MSDQNLIQIKDLKQDLNNPEDKAQTSSLLPPIDPNKITYYNQEPSVILLCKN